jgi:hypothetical protein
MSEYSHVVYTTELSIDDLREIIVLLANHVGVEIIKTVNDEYLEGHPDHIKFSLYKLSKNPSRE